jgi:hypothetical protein
VLYIAGAAVVLALAGTIVTLVIADRGQSPPDGGTPAEGTFTADSPWRLVIRNDSDVDGGCNVTLTHTDTGARAWRGLYGMMSYQVPDVGSFRWEANDILCRVIQRPGPGEAVLPFVHRAGTGDSDAFTPPEETGKITVEVLEFHGGTECKFALKDVADGTTTDLGTVNEGDGPRPLGASGRSQVYLDEVDCDAQVSAG